MGDLSKDFLPTAIAWNFSGFACMQLKLNQFDIVWGWGYYGNNWDILHIDNTKYARASKEDLLKEFTAEVKYCSDRMSLDRFQRCHWLFQQIRMKEETDVK